MAQAEAKRKRRKLRQIVLRKQRKIDRNDTLEKLKKVQLSEQELNLLHSTVSMQTKGLKRFAEDQKVSTGIPECFDATALIKRKRRKIKKATQPTQESSSEDTDAISTDDEVPGASFSESTPKVKAEPLPQVVLEPVSQVVGENKDQVDVKLESQTTDQPLQEEPKASENPEQEIKPKEPATYVLVKRSPEVDEARSKLPIIGEEHRIIEEIRYNDVVIISGETGSGKTTQLPQFLYEAGYALNGQVIGITEPRRVAAVSMSERVAKELNLTQEEVSYQIRFSGTVSDETKIKFMTDGVLLKECQHDFLLSRYSILIIDEAHERSVFSDILIGLLSRIVPLRAKKGNPLKLVIMSATLRVCDFTENKFLFPQPPPVIEIEARQYPVTIKFEARTPENYLEAAFKKVIKIDKKMPVAGGILVFVTSQMDVKILCNRLKKKCKMLHCIPLYAMLPLKKQRSVFEKPPEGRRLCVIATNVAETSITIPNVKYVVDTGKEKRKTYNLLTGVSRFITTWTSKSSAEQRTGRAGRMGPGHCYRLYSSAVFTNDFDDFSEPQILSRPVEDVLLQMKAMNIDNVVNFPFPTPPSIEALKAAEKTLIAIGALDDSKYRNARYADLHKTEYASTPTKLGLAMSKFSIGARCSRMIVVSPPETIHHVISLVSAMTVREMFVNPSESKDLRKEWAGQGGHKKLGDFMVMLKAVIESQNDDFSIKSCTKNGIRPEAILEADKLRRQLITEAKSNLKYEIDELTKFKAPSESQCRILRKLLLGSFSDHVARKLKDGELPDKDRVMLSENDGKQPKKKLKGAYECKQCDDPVYISSDSVLKGLHPEFVIFKELYQGEKKTYMRDIAIIEPEWVPSSSLRVL